MGGGSARRRPRTRARRSLGRHRDVLPPRCEHFASTAFEPLSTEKAKPRQYGGFCGGRYWARTSDPSLSTRWERQLQIRIGTRFAAHPGTSAGDVKTPSFPAVLRAFRQNSLFCPMDDLGSRHAPPTAQPRSSRPVGPPLPHRRPQCPGKRTAAPCGFADRRPPPASGQALDSPPRRLSARSRSRLTPDD